MFIDKNKKKGYLNSFSASPVVQRAFHYPQQVHGARPQSVHLLPRTALTNAAAHIKAATIEMYCGALP